MVTGWRGALAEDAETTQFELAGDVPVAPETEACPAAVAHCRLAPTDSAWTPTVAPDDDNAHDDADGTVDVVALAEAGASGAAHATDADTVADVTMASAAQALVAHESEAGEEMAF